MVFDPILILFIIVDLIPRKLNSPTVTLPPVTTLGAELEKSPKILSWSIEDRVLITQWLPIIVPGFIIEPETTSEPGLIFTFFPIIASREMTVPHLIFCQNF